MTTLTRPTWFRPRECTLGLRKSGLQFVSPFNGTMQAVDTLAERWVMNLSMPGASDGGGRSAFFNQWAGGVNHVALYHFGRPHPLGTLRGAPTLAGATARGDSSLSLVGCTNSNLLLNGRFSVDTNSDGASDGWSLVTGGAVSGAVAGRPTVEGLLWQQVSCTSLGTSTSDAAGFQYTGTAVSVAAGQTYTLSVDCATAGPTGSLVRLQIDWGTAGDVYISTSSYSINPTPGDFVRPALSAVAPSGAATARPTIVMTSRNASAGEASVLFRNARMEMGSTATSDPGLPNLLAGDMVSDGTQLYQVADDCAATDAGAMTVPVVNRARGVVASGTVVQWDRPTALFALPTMEQSTTWLRGGHVESIVLDAVEVY